MERKQLPYLPIELIVQILLRLPVRSLIHFKCVCKFWFSLISHDPQFANSHFEVTATHVQRVLFTIQTLESSRSIDLEASLNDDNASALINPHFMLPKSDFLIEIKCSCRGFILLHTCSNLILWNPSTGIHKQIPFSLYGFNSHSNYFYGFGYDESTSDYLLVSLSYDTSPILDDISPHLEFYSLRADTWKAIEGTYFPYMNASSCIGGSLFNGVIHWLAFRDDLSTTIIVSFDLTEMKLFDMPFPNDCNREHYCELSVFGEFLSLWVMDYSNDTVEIWVMKEYKVHSSWTKTLVPSIIDIPYFSFVCCTKSGDIIGTDGYSRLMKYDDKGQLLERHTFSKDKNYCRSKVTMYTESLLSLPTDGMQG